MSNVLEGRRVAAASPQVGLLCTLVKQSTQTGVRQRKREKIDLQVSLVRVAGLTLPRQLIPQKISDLKRRKTSQPSTEQSKLHGWRRLYQPHGVQVGRKVLADVGDIGTCAQPRHENRIISQTPEDQNQSLDPHPEFRPSRASKLHTHGR